MTLERLNYNGTAHVVLTACPFCGEGFDRLPGQTRANHFRNDHGPEVLER